MGFESLEGGYLLRDGDRTIAFKRRSNAIYRAVNRAVNLNNNDLVLLVRSIATHGTLSRNRYRQFVAKGHPMAAIEAAVEVASSALEQLAASRRGIPSGGRPVERARPPQGLNFPHAPPAISLRLRHASQEETFSNPPSPIARTSLAYPHPMHLAKHTTQTRRPQF